MSVIQPGSLPDTILGQIGNTPLVRLDSEPDSAVILAKLEAFNPGGSVKDRVCLAMVNDALAKGLIGPGCTIIEPTSGNTGIGLAMVAAVMKLRCIIVMPESMSLERIYIIRSFGAEVVTTPAVRGMTGSIEKAEQILLKTPCGFIPQQFCNPANPRVHAETTAAEVLRSAGRIDAFTAGVGTGGTITGVGGVLKKKFPGVVIAAVEPEGSPVLSGGKPGPHKIQGIGAGFIPEILDRSLIDEVIKVADDDAFETACCLAKSEGIFAGISSGAAVWAARQLARRLGPGKTVLTVLPDTGERYFSLERYYGT